MDVKEAVAKAKAHVADLFSDENPTNIGLEEVEFDELHTAWKITIGFSRQFRAIGGASASYSNPFERTFKVVRINSDGIPVSVKNRKLTD